MGQKACGVVVLCVRLSQGHPPRSRPCPSLWPRRAAGPCPGRPRALLGRRFLASLVLSPSSSAIPQPLSRAGLVCPRGSVPCPVLLPALSQRPGTLPCASIPTHGPHLLTVQTWWRWGSTPSSGTPSRALAPGRRPCPARGPLPGSPPVCGPETPSSHGSGREASPGRREGPPCTLPPPGAASGLRGSLSPAAPSPLPKGSERGRCADWGALSCCGKSRPCPGQRLRAGPRLPAEWGPRSRRACAAARLPGALPDPDPRRGLSPPAHEGGVRCAAPRAGRAAGRLRLQHATPRPHAGGKAEVGTVSSSPPGTLGCWGSPWSCLRP